MKVLRWGRSEYETDEDIAMERAGCAAVGASYEVVGDHRRVPEGLEGVELLVVTSKSRVTDAVLDALAGSCVVTTTSGYDHIDVAAARARGITVGRSPEARRDAVVEHTLEGLIWGLRRMPPLDAAVDEGRWARDELSSLAPRGISGGIVVVVGLGVIGTRVAGILDALGAEVRGVDPFVSGHPHGGHSLLEAVAGADALTLHCALTPSSRGLVGADVLDRLPGHAVVVNTARGESLDVGAATERVEGGRLGALVCDVFPSEPHPDLSRGSHPQIRFTPHSAGYTHDLGRRVADSVIASVKGWSGSRTVPHPVLSPS